MMNNKKTLWAKYILLAVALFYLFALPTIALAQFAKSDRLPSLAQFVQQVRNGNAETLRGVYIQNVLALPVVQQPWNDANYISPSGGTLTQFGMAERAGSVGLLAHNYLAGEHFSSIHLGNEVTLVYGSGRIELFTVTQIYKYEAMPDSIYRNIETQEILDIGELFARMYGGEKHVTLQTCIEKDGNLNWGRLFVIAELADARVPPPPPPPPHVCDIFFSPQQWLAQTSRSPLKNQERQLRVI